MLALSIQIFPLLRTIKERYDNSIERTPLVQMFCIQIPCCTVLPFVVDPPIVMYQHKSDKRDERGAAAAEARGTFQWKSNYLMARSKH